MVESGVTALRLHCILKQQPHPKTHYRKPSNENISFHQRSSVVQTPLPNLFKKARDSSSPTSEGIQFHLLLRP